MYLFCVKINKEIRFAIIDYQGKIARVVMMSGYLILYDQHDKDQTMKFDTNIIEIRSYGNLK